MKLLSSIAAYREVSGMPDFDQLPQQLLPDRADPAFPQWKLFARLERRMQLFDWLLLIAPNASDMPWFLNDAAVAFLLAFEASIQSLQPLLESRGFRIAEWLAEPGRSSLAVKGIRSLRNIEAHVRPVALTISAQRTHSRFPSPDVQLGVMRCWPTLSESERGPEKRYRFKVNADELVKWNDLTTTQSADSLMLDALRGLPAILLEAQRL